MAKHIINRHPNPTTSGMNGNPRAAQITTLNSKATSWKIPSIFPVTDSNDKGLSPRQARRSIRRRLRELVLRDDAFKARDVFQQALAGQHQEVVTELRILEINFQ